MSEANKTVVLTVRVTAIVPKDCNHDLLCMHIPEEGVEVVDIDGRFVATVEEYSTESVEVIGCEDDQ